MARSLVDMLTEDLDLAVYEDNYREALLGIIRAKAEGLTIETPQPAVAKVTDLMEALRASVEAAKARREAPAPERADEPEDEVSKQRRKRRAS